MLRFTNTKNLQLLIHVSIILLSRKTIKLIEIICVMLLSYIKLKKPKKTKLCETMFRTFAAFKTEKDFPDRQKNEMFEILWFFLLMIIKDVIHLLILSLNWKSIFLKHLITLFICFFFFSFVFFFTSISMTLSL